MPLSLVATDGISFDFFSSGYLDISVHRLTCSTCVEFLILTYEGVSPFGDRWIKAS